MTESRQNHTGDWRETAEQAREARWALRILTCPSAACRRRRACQGSNRCPGLQRFPISEAEAATALRLLRIRVEERLAELRAGPEAGAAADAARDEAREGQRRLAFKQAREILGREVG